MAARHLLLLIAAVVMTSAPLVSAAAEELPEDVPCTRAQELAGFCTPKAENGEGGTTLTLTEINEGQSPVRPDAPFIEAISNPAEPARPVRPIVDYCKPMDSQNGPCGRMDPAEPGTEAVTLTDVARYKPAAPTGISQPDGWGLLDRPVNFVVSAEAHIVTGQLLGQPADVRFTPVGFRMETSDGAVIESVTPGETWEALGQDDFTETPTSHVFTERGTHTITPTVIYIAEYRFAGSDWVTVPSVLPIPGEPRDILIGTIETVLVPNPGE